MDGWCFRRAGFLTYTEKGRPTNTPNQKLQRFYAFFLYFFKSTVGQSTGRKKKGKRKKDPETTNHIYTGTNTPPPSPSPPPASQHQKT
ncbi:hypothetical protein K440DRAFT_618049 [Wilcoxina mikolae CBS 423.85]|nr:hypothetical protein K440DRAFT_618049 [Wilcoxina mikolae CBS 423.85]